MKVVFLNATGQLGGAERMLLCLVKALRVAEPDWTLEVITGDEGPLTQAISELGIDIRVLPMPPLLAGLGEASSNNPVKLVLAALAAFRYRNRLRSLLASRKPDMVHSMNFKMHLLAACSSIPGTKLCWHIHDFVSNRFLTRKLMRFLSSRPDCVVAISESVARDIRSVSKCPGRITTVLNAIDIDHFSPDGPTWTSGPLPSVGLIATFARWKGHEVFLRAIASLPFPVHGYIAGGALYRTQGSQVTLQELKELAERLGLADRVTFTGFLEDPAPLLRSLDVIVHASIEPEPFGLTIAEAMACGKAVVASMAGGVTELIEPGVNGLGHAPGDVKGLALAIEHLLRDPDLRRQYGLAARAFASTKFSPARMARQFVEVYANC